MNKQQDQMDCLLNKINKIIKINYNKLMLDINFKHIIYKIMIALIILKWKLSNLFKNA